jgi:hypothetical protein
MRAMNHNEALLGAVVCALLLGFQSHVFSDDLNENQDTEYEWGPVSEGYQLSIQAEKQVYAYCEPIVLKITIRNNGPEPGLLIVARPDEDYTAVVKNSKGKAVPLTAYGRHLRDFLLGGLEQSVHLDPGQKREYTLLVNRIHDMTRKDTYSVIVKRYVYKRDDKGSAEVLSNTIQVEVKGEPASRFDTEKKKE